MSARDQVADAARAVLAEWSRRFAGLGVVVVLLAAAVAVEPSRSPAREGFTPLDLSTDDDPATPSGGPAEAGPAEPSTASVPTPPTDGSVSAGPAPTFAPPSSSMAPTNTPTTSTSTSTSTSTTTTSTTTPPPEPCPTILGLPLPGEDCG